MNYPQETKLTIKRTSKQISMKSFHPNMPLPFHHPIRPSRKTIDHPAIDDKILLATKIVEMKTKNQSDENGTPDIEVTKHVPKSDRKNHRDGSDRKKHRDGSDRRHKSSSDRSDRKRRKSKSGDRKRRSKSSTPPIPELLFSSSLTDVSIDSNPTCSTASSSSSWSSGCDSQLTSKYDHQRHTQGQPQSPSRPRVVKFKCDDRIQVPEEWKKYTDENQQRVATTEASIDEGVHGEYRIGPLQEELEQEQSYYQQSVNVIHSQTDFCDDDDDYEERCRPAMRWQLPVIDESDESEDAQSENKDTQSLQSEEEDNTFQCSTTCTDDECVFIGDVECYFDNEQEFEEQEQQYRHPISEIHYDGEDLQECNSSVETDTSPMTIENETKDVDIRNDDDKISNIDLILDPGTGEGTFHHPNLPDLSFKIDSYGRGTFTHPQNPNLIFRIALDIDVSNNDTGRYLLECSMGELWKIRKNNRKTNVIKNIKQWNAVQKSRVVRRSDGRVKTSTRLKCGIIELDSSSFGDKKGFFASRKQKKRCEVVMTMMDSLNLGFDWGSDVIQHWKLQNKFEKDLERFVMDGLRFYSSLH